jgi:N utilization substance protein B|tara:strand:- start:1174 stop:1593 length:420 start_codon:yes stop_codon:yes gene_type:complete
LSSRSKSRKRALDALYASGIRNSDAMDLLQETASGIADRQNQAAIFDYAEAIVVGVTGNLAQIDNDLRQISDGWSLERMPNVDRSILRLGAWEILYNDDVPNEVAIAEAVSLAGEYSTDDSPKFINGVLARLAKGTQAL